MVNKKRLGRPKRAWMFFLCLILLVFHQALGAAFPLTEAGEPASQSLKNPATLENLRLAKARLQEGVNSRKPGLFKEARDLFLGCLMQEESENAFLLYYVALADFRLASDYLISGQAAESENSIAEGQKYLEKALALDPGFGEAEALYAYLIGMELAFHPDRAMTQGRKSLEAFNRALETDPENPRVHFLMGIYQLYVPEAYGGGPDSALSYLEKGIALFDKETGGDTLRPSWGREETLTNAALIYRRKNNTEKAVELLKKAISVNPDYGRARAELDALEKKDPGRIP